MTIGKKLLLGFGAIIALTGVLGLIALMKIRAVADGVERFASQSLPDVYLAGKLSGISKEQKVAMLSHIASSDAAQMAIFDTAITVNTNKLVEVIKAYEKTHRAARDSRLTSRLLAANESVLRTWVNRLRSTVGGDSPDAAWARTHRPGSASPI